MPESAELIPYDSTIHADLAVQLWAAACTSWRLSPEHLRGWTDGTVAVDEDGGPIGFVALDPTGAIEFLVVSPDHRRTGIGSALLENAPGS